MTPCPWMPQWLFRYAWKIPWAEACGWGKSLTLTEFNFTFTFNFMRLEKEMATHLLPGEPVGWGLVGAMGSAQSWDMTPVTPYSGIKLKLTEKQKNTQGSLKMHIECTIWPQKGMDQ